MEKKFKLGVIGAGFMASAIVNGALVSGALDKKDVLMSDISEESLSKAKALGVNTTTDNLFLANNSEYVLFAVKPQSLNAVLESLKGAECNKFITIMAGIKIARIKSAFPSSVIARCMPNTPCSIGSGAIGVCAEEFIDESDKTFVKALFEPIAKAVFVKEEKLNAVTGISGSAPAYFYAFVKAIIDSGVKHGLEYEEAKQLAVATMIGSGKMIQNNPEKPIEELISAVCSKGGTTIQAVNAFTEGDLDGLVERAIDACVKRSVELENC